MSDKNQKSKKEELKPCPFCGSDEIELIRISPDIWSIGCINSDCSVKPFANDFDPKNRVILSWNTRVEPLK